METYTLILSKGTYLIDAKDAVVIKEALRKDERVVDIRLDPFGGFDSTRKTTIAVRHVVALTVNPKPEVLRSASVGVGNVSPMRRSSAKLLGEMPRH